MDLRALIFDVNGTLIDIETNEGLEETYRFLAQFLAYQGILISRWDLRDLYFSTVKEQLARSAERYPELDVVAAWREILRHKASDLSHELPPEKWNQLPTFLAEMHRSLSRIRLQLYPNVRQVLEGLRENYALAAVTNALSAYSLPELRAVGLADLFNPVIVSGDFGYRKPDSRLFEQALHGLGVRADQALFVGNDLEEDVAGARAVGLRTVLFAPGPRQIDPFSTQADYVIYHFADLPQAIQFLAGK
jgi:putative hydrolase of the HAD superfamily